jgi:hypothetical protein
VLPKRTPVPSGAVIDRSPSQVRALDSVSLSEAGRIREQAIFRKPELCRFTESLPRADLRRVGVAGEQPQQAA